MKRPYTFFNRELSWIEFNARVLYEGCRRDIPVIERLKFLAIVSSNFDEFFMVRVAGLKRQQKAQPDKRDIAGLTAEEQLSAIAKRVHELVENQYRVLMNEVIPALSAEGIEYVPPKNYTAQQRLFTQTLFQDEIFPLLTPLRTDTAEFPHISNLKLHAAFLLSPLPDITVRNDAFAAQNGEQPVAVVQVPSAIPRIVVLPSPAGRKMFSVLDDIISEYGTLLFPGYTVEETMLFKVTRDADFAVDEDAGSDFIQAMEEVLEKRQSSFPVRLVCTRTSPAILAFLMEKQHLSEKDVYRVEGLLDPSTLLDLADLPEAAALKYEDWERFYPEELHKDVPLWDTLKQRDILLHVPYQSYEPVISFVNDAADDGDVLAIKMTLYRTSGNSPIIRALERAARNGKQVTVFVELKARFDEKQNISWAAQLEKAGVIVVYGIVNLKVHAKILLVVRRESAGIRRYVHLSTGNYNDKTAKFYVDMSLFTANQEIANDATLFFNIISGYSVIQPMKRLIMAPVNLKSRLIDLIEREISLSTPESPGLIMAKMNSLGHREIIEALYRASRAGVQIALNVRGICMLVPGVREQSEHICVTGIIDRYLEHTRIFYFLNGGAEELYLSSADWMPRNLDRRVELMFPITQENIFKTVKDTLLSYFKDNTHAQRLQPDGSWQPVQAAPREENSSAQRHFYHSYRQIAEISKREIPLEFVVRRKD
ncbi:Polyphosphate kinase [Treponema brennaborense DSM 12168]|uniref:Polyphosphate kinase n=2 Tax=Treponema TaxID=157 RepID=F4LMJ1_TREBD|nr:Polyphosphate kinase [Treponema brennaborense DSM 12168]